VSSFSQAGVAGRARSLTSGGTIFGNEEDKSDVVVDICVVEGSGVDGDGALVGGTGIVSWSAIIGLS
jgi:hypothetical protein